MVSRREFERERANFFVTNLFWQLDSWISSLKAEIHSLKDRCGPGSVLERQKVEEALRHGSVMPVSKLALMVGEAYRRWYAPLEPGEESVWEEVHLNKMIDELANYSRGLFESMGSSILVSEIPEAVILTEKVKSGPLFTYVIWWILDAWPDGRISVDFAADAEKVHIIFQDTDHIYTKREYQENHKILSVWACIVDYLTVVEHHGWCVWPKTGESRRLEIILPVRPPKTEELNAPLPEWMQ